MQFEQHDVEWTPDKISRFWNYYQKQLGDSEHYFGAHHGAHVSRLINKKIRFSRLSSILDLSCGLGSIIAACLPLLSHGQKIYGTDFSSSSVDHVNRRFERVEQFKGAKLIREFPTDFGDEFFDLIISTEVVEHLTDNELDAMLKESYRLLKRGGFIFITTPNQEERAFNTTMCPDCGGVFHRWQHLRSWSATSLSRTVEGYGFQTRLAKPIAWGDTGLKRAAYSIATRINLKVQDGLVYVGQKVSM